jgi:hypothetical protein
MALVIGVTTARATLLAETISPRNPNPGTASFNDGTTTYLMDGTTPYLVPLGMGGPNAFDAGQCGQALMNALAASSLGTDVNTYWFVNTGVNYTIDVNGVYMQYYQSFNVDGQNIAEETVAGTLGQNLGLHVHWKNPPLSLGFAQFFGTDNTAEKGALPNHFWTQAADLSGMYWAMDNDDSQTTIAYAAQTWSNLKQDAIAWDQPKVYFDVVGFLPPPVYFHDYFITFVYWYNDGTGPWSVSATPTNNITIASKGVLWGFIYQKN